MMTEEEYKAKLKEIHGDSLSLCGRFKGITNPVLIQDKYGILQYKRADQILKCQPNIKSALNKTEYFMNQLKEVHPEIYKTISPLSEYTKKKEKMLFKNKYGIVAISPDALYSGHCPNIRSAINRKEYFRNQLLYLYDNKYDFKIESTDRHNGRVILICPIHGEQSVDSDTIFNGCGCPKCNKGWTKSNILYVIKLIYDNFSCYKLGVSYKTKNGEVRRFKDYKLLGYDVEVITTKEFDTYENCHDKELELKQLIKKDLVTPPVWENKKSTECFKEPLLNLILQNL